MAYTCIQPAYVKNFHCDGSLCSAKCCRGWLIEVDEVTYTKYQQLPDRDLRQRVLGKLKKNTSFPTCAFLILKVLRPVIIKLELLVFDADLGSRSNTLGVHASLSMQPNLHALRF